MRLASSGTVLSNNEDSGLPYILRGSLKIRILVFRVLYDGPGLRQESLFLGKPVLWTQRLKPELRIRFIWVFVKIRVSFWVP